MDSEPHSSTTISHDRESDHDGSASVQVEMTELPEHKEMDIYQQQLAQLQEQLVSAMILNQNMGKITLSVFTFATYSKLCGCSL